MVAEDGEVKQFAFEAGEEALGQGVVEAVSHGVHRALDAGFTATFSEVQRSECKSSLRWDLREQRVNEMIEGMTIKTVAGFLNGNGGTLLIGVGDDGEPLGLQRDFETLSKKPDHDGLELHLQQLFVRSFGEATASSFLTVNFHQIDGRDICQVTVEPSDHPVYVEQKGQQAVFWLRVGNATRSLPINEAVRHIQTRWSGR